MRKTHHDDLYCYILIYYSTMVTPHHFKDGTQGKSDGIEHGWGG
jgi:hypothetical protein